MTYISYCASCAPQLGSFSGLESTIHYSMAKRYDNDFGIGNTIGFGYDALDAGNAVDFGSYNVSNGNLFENFESRLYQSSSLAPAYKTSVSKYHINTTTTFDHGNFLKPERPFARFINCVDDVKEAIEKTFFLATGLKMPEDISIAICDEDKFRKALDYKGGSWHPSILGFSVQPNEVIVKSDDLDRLMLTIGHEIGHLMSKSLRDIIKEEAKAFAFELAWMKAMKENDILNLGRSLILPNPAVNGIHDKSLEFVLEGINSGKKPLELFMQLSCDR
jgi:hypothetical protein